MRQIIYGGLIALSILGCGSSSSSNSEYIGDINGIGENNSLKESSLNFRKSISLDEKIAGLYIFYFNRAPDWDGFNYWRSRGYDENEALNKLSLSFSQHDVFISTYSDLDNRTFVEAIYNNVLGKDGDEEGIEYWTSELNRGVTRSNMVSSFVSASLGSDLTKENFPNLSEEELQDAQARQDLISNKVNVALYFTNLFQEKSNISDIDNPENDPAYQASIKVLEGVTTAMDSVTQIKEYLDSIVDKDNPIEIINDSSTIPTSIPTPLPTIIATPTPIVTPTPQPTMVVATPTPTVIPTPQPTMVVAIPTPMVTPTPQPTMVVVATPTPIVTPTPTPQPTMVVVATPTPTVIPTPTPQPTIVVATPTPTVTPTPQPTMVVATPTPTVTPTPQPTMVVATPTPTVTPTPQPTMVVATPTPTATPISQPTMVVATPTPTVTPTPQPTIVVATPTPTATPISQPTMVVATPTPTVTPTPTPQPTVIATPTPTPTPTPLAHPATEAGIQEALDDRDYDYVISQLTSNRDAYNDLNDDEVNINIAGAYVGKSGYTVFDITSAISNSGGSLNGFVSETTKDNDAVDTINQLQEADEYYNRVVNGVNCGDTTTLTEEQKSACYNLGLVKLTSLSNGVKLLFGGDADVTKKWADGVDINSSDDLSGNGVVDEADASACTIVYASDPSNPCREGSMATYRKRVTFTTSSGTEYNATLIDVDIGNPNLGYTTYKRLVGDGSALLTDGVCDKNFNKTTNQIDGVNYFPCPVVNNGDVMTIADSLNAASNVQSLFPNGSETRTTIESYVENITGSKDGVITQDNLGIYLQSH